MIVVGLDLATNSAAAYGRPGEVPRFQHWKLEGDRGQKGLEFLHRFRTLLDELKVEAARADEGVMVFIEAPIDVAGLKEKGGFGNDSETLLMLNGLIFLAETVAASRHVPTQLLKRQAALRHFTGRATYGKAKKLKAVPKNDLFAADAPINQRPAHKNLAKAACIARCKQLRWPATTPDEADGAAIWDLGCSILRTNSLQKRVVNA